jgi:predicted nuclease of predicted toxin-antitoxin system
MRFIVDECLGPVVARWLRNQGHDVVSIFESARGSVDVVILAWAARDDRVLLTADKGFGDLVFRDRHAHRGVILLRLDVETARNTIRAVADLLAQYADQIDHHFVVVTETSVRFNRGTGSTG